MTPRNRKHFYDDDRQYLSDEELTSHDRIGQEKGGRFGLSGRALIIIRFSIVAVLILVIAFCIQRAAFRTTVVHADEWTAKANAELQKEVVIQPVRGDILAADGSVLATNLRYYNVRMDFRASNFKAKEFVAALDSLCDSLAKYHPVRTASEWKAHFNSQLAKPKHERSHSFTLLHQITHEDMERIRNSFPFFHRWRNPNKTGLTAEDYMRRSYPYGEMARRSIGRVGQTAEDPEVHGRSGLERALDSLLYGVPGRAKRVPLTHAIGNWTDVPAVNGYTLRTTIDIGIQDIVENELNAMLETTEASWGTAILMEVKTGDIKAISNLERDTLTGKYVEAMNRALQGFEPGSVMKTISMTVALEDGFVTNLDEVYNIGSSYVYGGGSPIRDTHSPAQLPVRRFLEYSSNIGMTKLVAPHFAKNPNGFRERLRELGFLDRFNTGIAGEEPPYFPTLDLKAGGLVSLGRQTYGYTSRIPPLYMCAFYNAIANDGKFVRPRIVTNLIRDGRDSALDVTYVREQMCTPEHARQIREMLHEVIYGKAGTARMLKNDFVELAGKTGTSRIARELSREDRERSARLMKLAKTHADSMAARPKAPVGYVEGRYRLAFCGFFPYDKPLYTCMVFISNPAPQYRGAGYTSGMVFRNIAMKMYSRGMLNNSSDYARNADGSAVEAAAKLPTVHAGASSAQQKALKDMLGTQSVRRIVAPRQGRPGTVPNVVGLSVRNAVRQLEREGYNVRVSGQGYVAAQSPGGGTALRKGGRVTLSLQR
ncbi:MAG: penicillin-binding transpeptidase domain-containing protein [Muribaculaceae bacterium]|nr:penicillin-binding transpeptidase domain-containing protein [Muribaculaceae bacterium]